MGGSLPSLAVEVLACFMRLDGFAGALQTLYGCGWVGRRDSDGMIRVASQLFCFVAVR